MKYLLFCLTLVLVQQHSHAQQTAPSPSLYETISQLDSLLFNAYNTRDLEKMKSFFDEDLEFYHDKGGLQNYSAVEEGFKNIFNQQNPPTRMLVDGSLEVYPIKDFGAIQTGRHTFCHPENGKQDCGTFKFMHVWQNINGKWKIKRIVSYDH